MKWSLFALLIGFGIDLIVGDPHGLPHPVVGIGKLISLLERRFRALFPKTERGEIFAGACIWLCTVLVSAGSRRSSSMARSGCPSICASRSRA